jgi:Ca2+-binding EF-hand superfamily protein
MMGSVLASSADFTDTGTRWQSWTQSEETTCQDVELLETFYAACRKRYRTLTRAWRVALDPDHTGKVSFPTFHEVCRQLGFSESRVRLWAALDVAGAGWITLEQWDPVGYQLLGDFRLVCRQNYGDLGQAFKYGMDKDRSNTVPLKELVDFCKETDFYGNPRAVFLELDIRMKGFLTVDDLNILDAIQSGEGTKRSTPKKWIKSRPVTSPSRARGFNNTQRGLLSMSGVQARRDRPDFGSTQRSLLGGTSLLSMTGVQVSTPRCSTAGPWAASQRSISDELSLSDACVRRNITPDMADTPTPKASKENVSRQSSQ